MTKAEILEAINATIAPNNVKGITAESLANILTEIVNATPEGGSGGVGGEYIDMTMANPDDPTSMELTPEAMAHNAEVFTKITNALSNSTIALPPITMSKDDLGVQILYAAAVSEEVVALRIMMPMGVEFANYMVIASKLTDGTTDSLCLGNDLMCAYLLLHSDGSIEISVPSLM